MSARRSRLDIEMMAVSRAVNRNGNAEPQLEVQLRREASYRAVNAALHQLAAAIELATPEHEHWIVHTESFHGARGRVYLELMDAVPDEVARAMTVLKQVAS